MTIKITKEKLAEEAVSTSSKDVVINMPPPPEESRESSSSPLDNLPKRMNSTIIVNIFKSWNILKYIGTSGFARRSSHRFKIIGTEYAMYVPVTAQHTWQIQWGHNGFKGDPRGKRARINERVSFQDVCDNVPEDIRVIFDLFVPPRA